MCTDLARGLAQSSFPEVWQRDRAWSLHIVWSLSALPCACELRWSGISSLLSMMVKSPQTVWTECWNFEGHAGKEQLNTFLAGEFEIVICCLSPALAACCPKHRSTPGARGQKSSHHENLHPSCLYPLLWTALGLASRWYSRHTEKFCKRNNQWKNWASRVVVPGVNAASGSHGPGNHLSLLFPSKTHATFLLSYYCPTFLHQLFKNGIQQDAGFLLTDGLTVLYIYLPFMVKPNIFIIHRCCEEGTGELWKKMNTNVLSTWSPFVNNLVIRGILQHSQS